MDITKSRIKEVIGLGTLFIAWLIILHFAWLMLYPYEPLIVNDVKIFNNTYSNGDIIIYEMDYCKNSDHSAEITKNFEDGIVFQLKSYTTNAPIGCHIRNATVEIPKTLPKGTYRLCVNARYNINFMRQINVKYVTPEFEVI